jgi:hypothetical protein
MLKFSVPQIFVSATTVSTAITGIALLAILGASTQSLAAEKTKVPSKAESKSDAKCADVAAELRAMEKAQQSISESLISNHDVFANLLTDYSSALDISAGMGKPVTKDAVAKMGESAKSFRERGKNAEKLNKKLTIASNEVIERAITCLKH